MLEFVLIRVNSRLKVFAFSPYLSASVVDFGFAFLFWFRGIVLFVGDDVFK